MKSAGPKSGRIVDGAIAVEKQPDTGIDNDIWYEPGPLSQAAWKRASTLFPGGVNSPVRSFASVGGTPPVFDSGRGALMKDLDGRVFADFCQSWGAHILGHSPRVIRAALKSQAAKATSFGAPSEQENKLGSLIQEAMPSLERLRFVNSGTEAVMSALRLARAVTGRKLIVKFDGCYHGHSDALLVQAGSGLASLGQSASAGVPDEFAALTLSLPYNDSAAVEAAFLQYPGQVAAVIVEPIAANMGLVLPQEGFLSELRKSCDRNGALLVFDEVITGFRVGSGGAQRLFGIEPDITTLGKIIGGGLPVGAFGGSAAVMDSMSPSGPVYQAGTLSGNPLAMAAGASVLKVILGKGFYETLNEKAETFYSKLKARMNPDRYRLTSIGSMFTFFCTNEQVTDYSSAKRSDTAAYSRLFHSFLKNGVYLPPSQFETAFIGAAHGKKELSLLLDLASRILA